MQRDKNLKEQSLGLWRLTDLHSGSCANHYWLCDSGHVTIGDVAVEELVSGFFKWFPLVHPRERSNYRRVGDHEHLIIYFVIVEYFISNP